MTLSSAGRAVVLAVCLTLAYTQLPLYSSNQNTYFLHGLAHSGFGQLARDWLAHTADPVPVFSALVRLTSACPPLFYLYGCALFGVYLLALLAIARVVLGVRASSRTEWTLAVVLIALHSGLLGLASERVFGANLPRLFERGLADQYLLGTGLQPSNFGILLLAGIVAAARQRYALAIACVAVAATFHPTYLLIAGMLTLTVLGVMASSGRGPRAALKLGLLGLALMGPIAAYVVMTFAPGPPGVHAEATSILVNVRIPHHALITRWFGAGAVFQIVLMLAGLMLARGTPVFPYLLWPFLAGATLTVVQFVTRDPSLALLFPWRFSVVLVPVSTTLIVGRLLLWVRDRVPRGWLEQPRLADAAIAASFTLLTLSGLLGTALRFRSAVAPGTRALMSFVKTNSGANDVYLVPTTMEGFRLGTGMPVFVDEKNHPYRDVDVAEWFQRIQWTRRLSAAGADSVSRVMRDLLAAYPVTVVVAEPRDSSLARCDVLARWHEVSGFTLYRVNPDAGATARPAVP